MGYLKLAHPEIIINVLVRRVNTLSGRDPEKAHLGRVCRRPEGRMEIVKGST